ncbi:hypothetical protein EJ08DRAFT_193627 [Tothia fuscella]|uniref:Uncharacterized protein n=1 Tax=Tothia fuscella TaxID=1048955 RepID=A0A9P4NSB9_9PEZI|nr:hypothetical protein EJ08DRAFT_193627 [Tothia fuscella]
MTATATRKGTYKQKKSKCLRFAQNKKAAKSIPVRHSAEATNPNHHHYFRQYATLQEDVQTNGKSKIINRKRSTRSARSSRLPLLYRPFSIQIPTFQQLQLTMSRGILSACSCLSLLVRWDCAEVGVSGGFHVMASVRPCWYFCSFLNARTDKGRSGIWYFYCICLGWNTP